MGIIENINFKKFSGKKFNNKYQMHHGLIFTGFYSAASDGFLFKRTAGGHRLATYLRKQGWDIEVLDFIMGWQLDQLKEFARSRITDKTKFIGFGGTFPIWSETVETFFKWIREKYPDIVTIVGGQIANVYRIEADWYVDGFGEKGLEALLKHITGNEKVKWQLGINGRKVIKANRDYPSFPMADLRIQYEDRDFILQNETLTTELGRGCIFNCSYCNFPVLGVKTDHSRDAQNLYDELLENYERFGVTKYTIADETVNDYTEKLEKFAKVIKNLPFKPRMYGFARADLMVARPQDWDIMIEMGFTGHHYGIESTNYETLKTIGKGMHPDKLLPGMIEFRKYFKKYSQYKSDISLIAGLPHETRETLNKTVNWFKENWKSEHVILFPLYIPKDNGMDTASKLTIDYKKYNYRPTEIDYHPKIREVYGRLPIIYGNEHGYIEHTGISWENDYWNVWEVMHELVKFYMEYPKFSGVGCWNVGDYELSLDKPFEYFEDKTISEIIGSENPLDFCSFQDSNKRLTDDYIEKKLNWRP